MRRNTPRQVMRASSLTCNNTVFQKKKITAGAKNTRLHGADIHLAIHVNKYILPLLKFYLFVQQHFRECSVLENKQLLLLALPGKWIHPPEAGDEI